LASNSPKLSGASLALAIVALAVFWSVMVAAVVDVYAMERVVFIVAAVAAVILGVAAVVTGVVARRRVRRGDAGKGGVALAGIVLGVVAVVVPAIILAWVVYTVYSDYQEFQQCVKGSGSAYPKYLCLKECPAFLDSLCRKEIGW
jgi:heme/copper-type cytochrome/quinol oxidase subunit 2